MGSRRHLLILTAFLFILASCRATETPTPEPDVPISPTSPSGGASAVEMAVVPTEDGLDPVPALPLLSPQASAAPTETPSPTPAPTLHQLTEGGCCVAPFWSPDGERVWYIDRPAADAPSGLWGVDAQGGEPEFLTDRLGIYSPDMQLRAFPRNGETVIERLSSGEQWRIPNGGRAVTFSPDGTQVAWTAGDFGPPFDTAQREVWVSRADGSQARQVFTATRGGFVGWFPDGRLLVGGRTEEAEGEQAYWALSLDENLDDNSALVELGRGGRLREAKLSPDGSWLAYLVTFSEDPNQDGLWLADTHSGARQRVELFGGYNWRDGERLLVVPLDLSQPVHRLLQVHAPSGQVEALTDPTLTAFKIANGDWSVSPDGQSIAFLSAEDRNIWRLEIPGGR